MLAAKILCRKRRRQIFGDVVHDEIKRFRTSPSL